MMTPLNDHVLISVHDVDPSIKGGVYVSTQDDGLLIKGDVLAFAPGIDTLKEGDVVLVGKYTGVAVPGDPSKKLVPFNGILAKE